MTVLRVEGLSVTRRGATLVEGVNLSIGKGQRLGLIGEAGAGKSVVALAILGLLPAGAKMRGEISFEDAPMPPTEAGRAALRGKRIGAMLQDAADGLDPLRTAGEHVREAIVLAGVTEGADERARTLLAEAGLEPDAAKRFARDLSASERRRLALALALAGTPELLIADAPTEGLDLIDQRRVLQTIERACTERDMALLLIAHDLKTVAMLCTRVAVMQNGRVVEAGEKGDVFGHPKHDFTRIMLVAARLRVRTLMRTPIGATLLDVRGVSRRFRQPDRSLFEPRPPIQALDSVSFSLRVGESAALIGPTGSGKTTLARIIAGLERADTGEVEFAQAVYHGRDMPDLIRREISFVFSDPATGFDPRLTVGESVAEPLKLDMQRTLDELSARIVEVVSAVGLSPDMLGRLPREFSAAQLQRLALARALITRPRLVLLDEPVASLDIAARGEIAVLLNRLRADFGVSFLVIAHDLDLMRVVADRVLVMDRGGIVETGTPAQLLEKPEHPLTQRLVAAQLPEIGIVPVF